MKKSKPPESSKVVLENLKRFNRKERDHLIKFALCKDPKEPAISSNFREILSGIVGDDLPGDKAIFIAMDYHLNWLYAALMVGEFDQKEGAANLDNTWKAPANKHLKNKNHPMQPNQQDVDLLLAFATSSSKLHIILIEAKLTSGWGSNQFIHKIERIHAIENEAIHRLKSNLQISWHFILASPKSVGPQGGEFSPAKVEARIKNRDYPNWVSPDNTGMIPHITFGPQKYFHVKREAANSKYWEIVPITLSK